MIGATMLFLLLQAAQPGSAPPDLSTKPGVEAEAKLYFAGIDANKDGKATRTEAEAFHAKAVALVEARRRQALVIFNQLDDNKDGMLSRDEYLAIAGTVPPAKEMWFDGNDANKDGSVTLNEAIKRVQVTFDALDTNKDGKLSAQEKAAARGAPSARP